MLTKFFFKCHALIHWNKNRTQYFVLCVLPIGLGLREFFYVQNIIPLVVNHFSPPLCFSYIKMWERFRTFHFFNWQSQEVTTALYCMTLCNTTCLYWLNNRAWWEIKIDIRFLSQWVFFTVKLNFINILFYDNKSFLDSFLRKSTLLCLLRKISENTKELSNIFEMCFSILIHFLK